VVAAEAGQSPGSYTSRLVALVNQARAQNGDAPLQVEPGTTDVAAAWTEQLASQGYLGHNPNLGNDLASYGSPQWTACGENVGQGPASNSDQLFTSYMNSPEHRANILNPHFRYLGIATVFTGSTAWNTMDFVDSYQTSAPPLGSEPPLVLTPRVAPPATALPARPTFATAAARHPRSRRWPIRRQSVVPVGAGALTPRDPVPVPAAATAAPVAAAATPSSGHLLTARAALGGLAALLVLLSALLTIRARRG
jgi:hypothetical protein